MRNFFKKIKFNIFLCLFKLKFFISKRFKDPCIICFDCLYDKNQEALDAFFLFEELQKKNINSKYIALKKCASFEILKDKKDVFFVNNRFDFFFKYANLIKNSSHIFTSFGLFCGLDEVLKALKNIEYVFIEHGVTFLDTWLKDIYSFNKFDKILIPTKFTHKLYKKNSRFSEEKMIFAGLSRWNNFDIQFQKQIFVFFTWRKSFLNNKEFLADYFKSISIFLEKLCNIVPSEIKITFAWHHEALRRADILPSLPKRIITLKPNEIYSAIQKSSLLVSDFSSVFWDFIYQKKPVVFNRFDFYKNDLEEIDKKIFSEVMNLDSVFSNCFYDDKKALDKILYYIKNDFKCDINYDFDEFFWDENLVNVLNF